jgi:hypothetical protein
MFRKLDYMIILIVVNLCLSSVANSTINYYAAITRLRLEVDTFPLDDSLAIANNTEGVIAFDYT